MRIFRLIYQTFKAPKARKEITNKKEIDRKYRYWRIRTMYSMYIGYAIYYFTRKSFTFALPVMITTIHLTKPEIGFIASGFYVSYGISKFLSGIVSDRANPRYFMACGLIITGILNIIFGFCSSLPFFAVLWILNGIFQGWGWPPCAKLLTHWYSQKERGVWWGVWNTCQNLGGALIPIIAAFSALTWGWRYALFVPGIIAIVSGFILINRLRDVPATMGLPIIEKYKHDYPWSQERFEATAYMKTKDIFMQYVLGNRFVWLLSLSYVMIYIVRTAVNDWGALYMVHEGFGAFKADSCMSFFEIGGLCGSLFAGWFSDKIFKGKRGPVNVIFALGIVLSLTAFWVLPGLNYIFNASCIFVIGFLVFGPQMMVGLAVAELSHKDAAGMSTGFSGLFGYAGAAISGYPIGLITQDLGWHGFFVAMIACALVGMMLLLPLWHATSAPTPFKWYQAKRQRA